MRIERKHALFLLAVGIWNWATYARFTKALIETPEERPTGYYVAHSVLIVVNLVIGGILGAWGVRALRGRSGDRAA